MKKTRDKKQRTTLIGGQALMEGVMMRGRTSMAMAVRDPDGDIVVETRRLAPKRWYNRVPVVRGCASFISSLVGGTSALLKSAEAAYPEEETPSKGAFAWATVLGVILAIVLFIVLPTFIVGYIPVVSESVLWFSLCEGGMRLVIFVLYLFIVSRMKDIRRTFMYHGAEHRTINCFESGAPLTVENVQKCSTRHNRCGTTFLFFVMVISIVVFSLVTWLLSILGWTSEVKILNNLIRLGVRLALLPVVAGLSYELLRFLACLPDNRFTDILRAPGLALQRLTTYPPDDDMAEVAIRSFMLVYEMDADPGIPVRTFGEFTMPEVKAKVKSALAAAGITEDAETDWLIASVLKKGRGELVGVKLVGKDDYKKINAALSRRVSGVPLDYITGFSEFYGIRLAVSDKVLIPRLDTEILADEAIKYIASAEAKLAETGGEKTMSAEDKTGGENAEVRADETEIRGQNRGGKDKVLREEGEKISANSGEVEEKGEGKVRVLDLMTGSGCIALAVAKKTGAEVTASDVSDEALIVARSNLSRAGVRVIKSDVFGGLEGEEFDVIISNPPYIRSGEIDSLAPDVKCQPLIALDGGEDGLKFYRLIAAEAPAHLKAGGMLFLEIGYDEREAVTEILAGHGFEAECIKDYAGNDRVIKARLKSAD